MDRPIFFYPSIIQAIKIKINDCKPFYDYQPGDTK